MVIDHLEEARVDLHVVPDPVLRSVCIPVKEVTPRIRKIAKDLEDYMLSHSKSEGAPVGLAAPQLGYSVRMIAFYPNPKFREEGGVQILINPELSKEKDYRILREGCTSIPGKVFQVKRALSLKLKGLTLDGVQKSFKARDILAQIAQHEVDHLNGILIDWRTLEVEGGELNGKGD